MQGGLSHSEVMSLLANNSKADGAKSKMALVSVPDLSRTKENENDPEYRILEWQDMSGRSGEKGGFTGKAGTLKRTRKGNVSRNLNGIRRYEQDGEWWDE